MEISLPSDLSEFVKTQVDRGAYPSEVAVVVEAVRLLKAHAPPTSANGQDETEAPRKPIWEVAQDIMRDVPEEVLDMLPVDGAEQHDHYIYGTPKRPR